MTTRSPLPHRSHAAALTCALAATLTPAAQADCIDDAAARYQVNAVVLRAIGWQESRLQPQALGRNANGSVDIGAFQINSVHLSELGRYGIDRAALADGCTNADVAAWHYRRQIERLGNSWQAVGAYHSATPAHSAWYANRIAGILTRWKVLPADALPSAAEASRAPGRPLLLGPAGRTSAIARPTASARPPPRPASFMPIESRVSRAGTSEPARSEGSSGTNDTTYRELAYLPAAR
jgi:hypothetical protein